METAPNDSPHSSQPPDPALELQYQPGSDQIVARWGMPLWAQIAFGANYTLAAATGLYFVTVLIGTWAAPIPLAALIAIPFHLHHRWRWRSFMLGYFAMLGILGMLATGFCLLSPHW